MCESHKETRGALLFDFRIFNQGTVSARTAPWQITRVHPGGLTFFPTGTGSFAPSNLAVRDAIGVTWYANDATAVTDNQKLFADGREGWLAHVDVGNAALLLKTFAVVPRAAQAPGSTMLAMVPSGASTLIARNTPSLVGMFCGRIERMPQ